jgi:2-oxoglutarate dehydrogenase E1 component
MDWSDFHGVNRAYVAELYERAARDPASVDPATRALLDALPPPAEAVADAAAPASTIIGAVNLIQSIRRYGHLAAAIDPLGGRPLGDPALDPQTHGVTMDDLRALPAALVSGPASAGATSPPMVDRLRAITADHGATGPHLRAEKRRWLRDAIESAGSARRRTRSIRRRAPPTDVEAFEQFLHRSFPGKTRFSVEGLDMLVPMLDDVISGACEAGLRRAFIGMAHRGRLNVMVHVLGKPYAAILTEFKDPARSALAIEGVNWTGDVKYHLGASRMVDGGEEVVLVVTMPPNPSHLESINPVLEGMARAAGTAADRPGEPAFDPDSVLPILIHGDAAFPGQGVVAETLNLHRLDGYTTGGTIHIIANNQIGFTTGPADAYSTLYASGLARAFKIPIVHVNADDPEACLAAARMAVAYREEFKRDFLIDPSVTGGSATTGDGRRSPSQFSTRDCQPPDREADLGEHVASRGVIDRTGWRHAGRTAERSSTSETLDAERATGAPCPPCRPRPERIRARACQSAPFARSASRSATCRQASTSTRSSSGAASAGGTRATSRTSGRSTGPRPKNSRWRRSWPTARPSG